MTLLSRRGFVGAAAGAGVIAGAGGASGRTATGAAAPAAGSPDGAKHTGDTLKSLTAAAQPIGAQEHNARLAKLQGLMQRRKLGALLVESGSSLEYFTGIHWRRSERTTAAVIPAEGAVVVVTPYFEEPSIRETLKVTGEVRPWKEDENPFLLLADALRGHTASGGSLAVEPTTRYFIIRRVTDALRPPREVVPADDLVDACRRIKSPAELALMQTANDVTLAALRHVHGKVQLGMQSSEIEALMVATTERLGGSHEFSLVLVNEASAYPHGSVKPQTVHNGSVILIDTGCTVHGYQSDISRTWVVGEPSARQREIWGTVKRGQEIALETAKIGTPAGAIDKAVRAFYEQKGWSQNYGLPGLSHRTGHGIGLDGHESPYLVRSDSTALEAGMCFSDEPGIYIPGEFGVRLEDCWVMTAAGPQLFTPLARSLAQPI